ncbi:hypothetical protein CGRA01v4_02103 [Colletotrichum graminicola]|uniref:Uncharacterized protein n=1 Tax=Colletotrichum graminicola (strain M1.001 / M2 / FGSC 10212) TaxID=645133 RepID=E3QRX4_COLGM|nr:uncharacterized protein GLRG_08541 [Colletotrichum graminicola M1.001]EFQ33612.1 hypothetical protein GLRG_08541 [Colletotrichum graminicola M1.001]WDK10823.1 hypothetical protein CGRA01v4_02103 [Colletotrichum graminicola]
MERSSAPLHTLYLSRDNGDAITVNLVRLNGCIAPLYSVGHNEKMTKMEVRRIRCDAVSTQDRPVGSIKTRMLLPRLDVAVRGVKFKMTRKHPLSNALSFRFLGVGEMRWEELGKQGRGMRLVDFNGKTLAHFRPRLHVLNAGGVGGGKEEGNPLEGGLKGVTRAVRGPGFELHSALADLDMDLIVTTGLAAAEHRRQLDEGWNMEADETEVKDEKTRQI